MSRFVVPRRAGLAAQSATNPPDGFTGRLAKYVPGDVLTLYTAAVAGVAAAKPEPPWALGIAIGFMAFFLVLTLIYFSRKAPAGPVRKAHLIASPIAFLALAYPIGAPLLGAWFVAVIAVVAQAVAAGIAWIVAPQA